MIGPSILSAVYVSSACRDSRFCRTMSNFMAPVESQAFGGLLTL
jgi:hypothetical protein